MAGDWIKMEVSTPDKPEVLAITARMGWDDPDHAVGKLFRVWRWFDQHTVDGNAPGVTKALLDRIAGVSGFADAMAAVGWLIADSDGVRLPGFEKHCGKTAKERAQTAKRVANHKFKARGNAGTVSEALPREDKREEKKEEKTLSGEPDSSPDSPAGLLAYLNEKTGKRFQPVPANLDFVKARLAEVTADEIRAVVDAKVAEWAGDDDMEKYLRPATLFNRTKFAQYMGEVGASKPAAQGGKAWWIDLGYGDEAMARKDGHEPGRVAA